MSDLWRAVLPVKTPFTDWKVAEFFLGLPHELRYKKRLVFEILQLEFPSLNNVGVISSMDHEHGNGVWWKNLEQKIVRKVNKFLTYSLNSQLNIVDRYATEDRKRLLFLHFRDQYVQSIDSLRAANVLASASCDSLMDIEKANGPLMYQLLSNAGVLDHYGVQD